nr:hypothetical protein 30 [bacterium]
MQCGKCKFVVPSNMRFCLMKNLCPACGSALFSDEDMNHISLLQNRILAQSFSKKFDQVEVFDLALFIYNEIRSGYGRTILDEELKKFRKSQSAESEEEVPSIQGDEPEAAPEESVEEAVRREVEAELKEQLIANLAEAAEEEVVDEDEDDRITRLKAQAKKANKSLSGASVRRVG